MPISIVGSKRSLVALVFALAVMAPAASCSSSETSPTGPGRGSGDAPANVWLLDGNGDAEVGEGTLAFDGNYQADRDAVVFDGASGFAGTTGPGPIDTTSSYSVAAWVSLAPPRQLGGAQFVTAVSQLGNEAAAFFLGVAEGRWSFSVKNADTNDPGHTIRTSAATAKPDPRLWRHLVGVYDQEAKQIRLYIDGEPEGEADFPDPTWQAAGPLTIGRAQADSAMSDFWPGAVADVRTFPSALSEDSVRALVDRGRPTSPPPLLPEAPPSALLPQGTYEYILSGEEAEQIASGFSPEEATAAGGFDKEVGVVLRIEDLQWQQYFTFDAKIFAVEGRPEGDGGTYKVDGDRVVTSNGVGDVAYRWSYEDNVLSLRLVDSAAITDADMVRLVTAHDYTLVSR